jgi:hypothetical protein
MAPASLGALLGIGVDAVGSNDIPPHRTGGSRSVRPGNSCRYHWPGLIVKVRSASAQMRARLEKSACPCSLSLKENSLAQSS